MGRGPSTASLLRSAEAAISAQDDNSYWMRETLYSLRQMLSAGAPVASAS